MPNRIIKNAQNASAAHSIPVNRSTKADSPEPLFIPWEKNAFKIRKLEPAIASNG
jgi:hypothetical protein